MDDIASETNSFNYMQPIWFKKSVAVEDLNQLGKGGLSGHIGIRFTEVGDRHMAAVMPVDERTRQPYGLLHGGASVALAETLGSVSSAMVIDGEKSVCVGIEVNANHIRAARKGHVMGTCTPLHLGKGTHVWEIKITDEEGKLVCISRLTVAILPRERFA